MDAISATVSGLNAAQVRLQVSANNIANANTKNYRAQEVVQTPRPSGGVDAKVVSRTPIPPATPSDSDGDNDSEAQDVSSSDANNVSVDQQVVDAQIASYDYKANLRVLKTENDLQQSLLDVRA